MCCHESSLSGLPADIVVDILSRLPIKTILHCRCVSKRWRNILLDPYFVNAHLSRSPTSLILHQYASGYQPETLKLVEIEDEPHTHILHHDPAMIFDLRLDPKPNPEIWLVGSVNGLVCLWQYNDNDTNFICNPITREYAVLPKHKNVRESYAIVIYGFGFSLVSSHYKVVRIFQGRNQYDPTSMSGRFNPEVEVYTLGTGAWRNVGHVLFEIDGRQTGASVNGNLHWLVSDPNSPEMICSFHIEKEVFQLLTSHPQFSKDTLYKSLGVLADFLCVCDNSSESELIIWMMKKYGVKESWCKEIVINKSMVPDRVCYEVVHPLRILEDGSVLMLWRDDFLFTYHPGTTHFDELDICMPNFDAMTYVPSFLTLKNFVSSENVVVF